MVQKGELSVKGAWEALDNIYEDYKRRVFFYERTGKELGE
jgi:hypothetical protein